MELAGRVAARAGASEAAARLFLSITAGYPFALVYRNYLFGAPPVLTHIYSTGLGLGLAYFNFGCEVHHSMLCVFVQYCLLRFVGRSFLGVATSFVFQMFYLLMGYYYTATDQYDIKWTMPHCVLTLKLIGLAFDYYDGGKDEAQLTAEQRRDRLPRSPSALELCGFAYFFGGFLVGPQFTMKRYLSLVNSELTDVPGHRPNSVAPALRRLGLGLVCVTVFAVVGPHIPDTFFLTPEYSRHPLWYKCVLITVWGKVTLYKYISCWLIAEGVCILCGLGYSGRGAGGQAEWDACANVKLYLYETTPYFKGTIAAFNIQTNNWAARHVFKRLRALGSKMASQAATLAFLAVWHGYHSGYFMCFVLELIIVQFETRAGQLIRDSERLSDCVKSSHLQKVLYVAQQSFHWLFLSYSLLPFSLLASAKWLLVYKSVYFIGHIFFLSQIILMPFYRKILIPKKHRTE
uniref:Lysophospholipid acyltransferase 5 n=1 Tax=Callorhinchus milii TaxID=7868 RepID=V9KVF5_CALMI